MLFNSVQYFIFAPLVVFVFFQLKDDKRRWWLLVTSLYFYAAFRVPFLFILMASIILTFFAAIFIANASSKAMKKLYLTAGVAGNLSILYFFKYIDFSFRVFNDLLGLSACDFMYFTPPGVILPLGISFFTLQAISYAVDVYRGEIPATRNFFDFTMYLTFFPQLVAGPIMRARDLLYQFSEKKNFKLDNLHSGLRLIAAGFVKKTFIGDQAGIIVDQVFKNPEGYDWISMWIALFMFAFQIYGDFSGYSDIAIGTGRILGFEIPENFRRPFVADSLTELWRRWHISLSTWLRDYIYIPLGGSRVSEFRFVINLSITWFITGAWHGADWTYVLWGLTQGILIYLERIFPRSLRRYFNFVPHPVKSFYALFLFSTGIFFFRAQPTVNSRPDLTFLFL